MLKRAVLSFYLLWSAFACAEPFHFPAGQSVHFLITQETIFPEAQGLVQNTSFDLEFLTPVPKVESFPAYVMISNITIGPQEEEGKEPFISPLIFELADKGMVHETSGQLTQIEYIQFFDHFFAQLMDPVGTEMGVGETYPLFSPVDGAILENSALIQIKKHKKGWYFGEAQGLMKKENITIEVEGKVRWKEGDFLIQERKLDFFIESQRNDGPAKFVMKESWFSI